MTPQPSFDASIPVLTEVFQDQPVRAEPRDLANASLQDDAKAVASWTDPDREALERRLCERILHQLQGRVDFVLEQRVRDSMEEALQHAMTGFTDEIRRSLQQTIEKIVVRAVAQELTHLQTLKK
ncbi:MAG: hypothetical protein JWR40_399 [Massilia sp.]|jgi:malonyl CoA-acyl carrier protein transacylase|nr:hypothetical protein [Massilia sp.]